ncbi:substrate-binding domain-containing protein, partial [Pseudomonas sp. TH10]|uniref:substrate-binding domain-containing protein n=1 Tax=Pseudomonas sp. TH10 TaxID=2796376 RepID=UPI0035A99ED6
AAAMLLENNPPSAIFAGNDMIGIGVQWRALPSAIFACRAELSVIGFDDIQMSRYVYPALTTVGHVDPATGRNGSAKCCCAGSPARPWPLTSGS